MGFMRSRPLAGWPVDVGRRFGASREDGRATDHKIGTDPPPAGFDGSASQGLMNNSAVSKT
jgi:hypothetical protein